jgi:hypothetical protein
MAESVMTTSLMAKEEGAGHSALGLESDMADSLMAEEEAAGERALALESHMAEEEGACHSGLGFGAVDSTN